MWISPIDRGSLEMFSGLAQHDIQTLTRVGSKLQQLYLMCSLGFCDTAYHRSS